MSVAAPSKGPSARLRPTGLEWLFLAGGVLLSIHYAWLLDDAYLYFRYVDNLVFLDRGLVFNAGEYAEGFTSPAWVMLLVGLRGLGLGFWDAVRGLAVVSFAAFWLAAVLVNRRLSPPDRAILNLPLAFLSFNYAALCYFSSGTESPLVQLAAGAFALFVLRPDARLARSIVAVSPLIRPELALPLGCAVLWARLRTGRIPWRLIALALVANGGWLVFRIVYYADLLPTTFYLKNVIEPAQGLRFLHDTLAPYHLYEVATLVALTTAALARWDRRRLCLPERTAMLVMAAAVTLYVVKIGGDPRHYRYLAFPFCLGILALGGIAEHAAQRWGPRLPHAALVGFGLAAAALAFSFQSRQLSRHPIFLDQRPRFVDGIADAAHHRTHPALVVPRPWGGGRAIEIVPRYARWEKNREGDSQPRILVSPICWKLYLHFEGRAIQSYGLTDAVLARTLMPSERAAHKEGLHPLARDLARIHRWWERPPQPGMFRAATAAGVAPAWIAANLETLEVVERKLYNRHRPLENLRLALSFPDPIDPHATAQP